MILPHRRPSLGTVAEIVEHLTGVTLAEIQAGGHAPRIIAARQLAAYMLYQYGEMSFSEIALALGYANHTSAMSARDSVAAKLVQVRDAIQEQTA